MAASMSAVMLSDEEDMNEIDTGSQTTDEVLSSPSESVGSDDNTRSGNDYEPAVKKKKGRKFTWSERHTGDMINIICNSEYYRKRLIFVNIKNAKNAEIYSKLMNELREQYNKDGRDFPFSVNQIRGKLKRCISECKKVALTVKTGTGIKRFQEEKGYGNWFNQLFSLVQSRESCSTDMVMEPSTSAMSPDLRSATHSTPPTSDESLFVPVKRASACKKTKRKSELSSTVETVKKVLENDPTKDLLNFFKEENERAREHELKLMQMFMASSSHCHQHQTPHLPQDRFPPPQVQQFSQPRQTPQYSVPQHQHFSQHQAWQMNQPWPQQFTNPEPQTIKFAQPHIQKPHPSDPPASQLLPQHHPYNRSHPSQGIFNAREGQSTYQVPPGAESSEDKGVENEVSVETSQYQEL